MYYKACISFTDFNLGRVLDALDATGLADRTVVLFHSDHGWSLGEAAQWEKFTNREEGTRVPLIVRVPWLAKTSGGARSGALAELVDVAPTLWELAGLAPPADAARWPLGGASLVPVLESANASHPGVKNASYSQVWFARDARGFARAAAAAGGRAGVRRRSRSYSLLFWDRGVRRALGGGRAEERTSHSALGAAFGPCPRVPS